MSQITKLAGQTAVYGLSSIIGRLLNYLLVPLYTRIFNNWEYGVVTELYTYVVFLMVILTYGLETGYFRFSNSEKDKDFVFGTITIFLFVSSLIFIAFSALNAESIASYLGYYDNPEYVIMFGLIIGLDAFLTIPFARLRQQNKALKFAIYKLLNILVNIVLNLTFLVYFPYLHKAGGTVISDIFYNQDIGVGYVFISNLVATAVSFLLFIPDYFKTRLKFSFAMLKNILFYSLPLVISGLAGMINEFFDRLAIKWWTTIPVGVVDGQKFWLGELGIYGANTKITIIIVLFVQMFRYAADPFFFSNAQKPDFSELYSKVTKYFFIVGIALLLFTLLYLDIFKHIIGSDYFEGLKVVPLLLLGRFIVGIMYILSFWYKLDKKTIYGIYIFLIGAVLTIFVNYLTVPLYGYYGCALSNFVSYIVMLLITYFWGRKHFNFNLDFKSVLLYSTITLVLYFAHKLIHLEPILLKLTVSTTFFLVFAFIVYKRENGRTLIKLALTSIKNRFYGNKNS